MDNAIEKADGNIQLADRGLALKSIGDMMKFAEFVVSSKLAPSTLETPEKIVVAMQMGQELGLSYMVSLKSIAVVNGTPTIYGDAALALVKRSGLLVDIDEHLEGDLGPDLRQSPHEVTAVCTVVRKGQEGKPLTREFSVLDAIRAGLWLKTTKSGGKTPWLTHPKRMMQYKARAFALRDAFPDCLLGMHFAEELMGEEPIHVESREVTLKSTELLEDEDDDGTEGRQLDTVPEQVQEGGQTPGLSGGTDDQRPDVSVGGLGEGRQDGQVHVRNSEAGREPSDPTGDGAKRKRSAKPAGDILNQDAHDSGTGADDVGAADAPTDAQAEQEGTSTDDAGNQDAPEATEPGTAPAGPTSGGLFAGEAKAKLPYVCKKCGTRYKVLPAGGTCKQKVEDEFPCCGEVVKD